MPWTQSNMASISTTVKMTAFETQAIASSKTTVNCSDQGTAEDSTLLRQKKLSHGVIRHDCGLQAENLSHGLVQHDTELQEQSTPVLKSKPWTQSSMTLIDTTVNGCVEKPSHDIVICDSELPSSRRQYMTASILLSHGIVQHNIALQKPMSCTEH